MSNTGYREGLSDLVKENQVLSENLSKCMEEKNFVWSLWKKLQTEKPELSSVISLVVAREKEKNEVRDAKVLNILETKDTQIRQLETEKDDLCSQIKEKDDQLKSYSLRLHDLLIEKADLQENLENVRKDFEEKIKGLVEENGYLSEVVRARQIQLENDEAAFKTQLGEVDEEKQELNKVVKDLEFRLGKLNEERLLNSSVVEENNALKDQLKTLQDKLMVLKGEHEDGMSTLRLRESQLQKHSNVIQEHKEILNEKENLIVALRNELNEVKLAHSPCAEYAREQSSLIESLQSLQEQTQSVIKAQEEKYKSEIIALKEQLGEEEKSRKVMEASVRQLKQECNKCMLLEQELQTIKEHNDELMEMTQQKNRRISSLEKTLVRKVDEPTGNSSYTNTLERKCKSAEQKLYELQKVLEYKQNELDALSSAHSNRLQRYKNLQSEHKIVLEQLKTFENLSDEEVRRPDVVQPIRASPRSLQKENSDSVWNELQHFKKEYEKLRNERDKVMEEIDVLRVEHANDVTTIHELRTCLDDEKRDLMEEIKLSNAQEKDEIRKEVKGLEQEKNDLKTLMETLRKDFDAADEENKSLKGSLRKQTGLVESLTAEVSEYKKELKSAKKEEKTKHEKEKKIEGVATPQNDLSSLEVGEKHSAVTRSDKLVQTDLTYEEQLQEVTKKIILDLTRDSFAPSPSQVAHRDTQTSPRMTVGELRTDITLDADGMTTADDSMLSRNETIDNCRNVRKAGDRQRIPENRSALGTPSKRLRMVTKSPIHREWKTMRQRVLSLTQQVAALKASKESLLKSMNQQKSVNEKLQDDVNQSQQRLKLSKQTIERLTKELEEWSRQKQQLARTPKEYKIPSYPTEKHLEERLKLASNECSRLSHELKCSRKAKEELQEKLKSSQERNSRQEHTLNQKKVFVDEMRSRLKVAQENLESTTDELKQAEEKARRMAEKENQRKNQLISLKRQLDLEAEQRRKLQRLHEQSQEELRKKAQLLSQAQALRQEAEMAVNEMEEEAKTQLHNLANESQVTLNAVQGRLTKCKQRIEEFQVVVRTLTERLVDQIVRRKIARKQETYKRFHDEKKKASMQQACELASSILNLSQADIDELLDVDFLEDKEYEGFPEGEWKREVEQALSKEESFAVPLVRILLEIVQNVVKLENAAAEESLTSS